MIPGETPEEFAKSLEFVRETGFAKAHVFAYSRRSGTVAYGLPGQVSRSEKAERSKRMIETAQKSESEFLNRVVGKTVAVLFETAHTGIAEGCAAMNTRDKRRSDDSPRG